MSSEKLISLLKAEPFHPFRMKLNDGEIIDIDIRRQLALMPGDTTCLYFRVGDDDSYFTIISLDAIAKIEVRKLPPHAREFLERHGD